MTSRPQSPGLPDYGRPISLAEAKRVMAAAETFAEERSWQVTITIVDSSGLVVMQHRTDQANRGSVPISRQKAETAINFRRPSKVYEELLAGGGLHLRLLAAADVVIPLEGGVPLVIGGKVVGAIGVSGMASHEDGQVAEAGAAALSSTAEGRPVQ